MAENGTQEKQPGRVLGWGAADDSANYVPGISINSIGDCADFFRFQRQRGPTTALR